MAEPETQKSLTSVLSSDERDIFLIKNNGEQVPLSELGGKTFGLYFSAHWCPPCRKFTPKLIEVYNELKQNGEAFEIVFLSRDKDEEAFNEYHGSMPWLALPFGDKLKKDLSDFFHIRGIPSLIIVGPDGEPLTNDGRSIVAVYGAKAFPFTHSSIAVLQKEVDAAAEKYPKEIMHGLHQHSLHLSQRQQYVCHECRDLGISWSFYCHGCAFDLHPDCALKDYKIVDKAGDVVCDGDNCRRA